MIEHRTALTLLETQYWATLPSLDDGQDGTRGQRGHCRIGMGGISGQHAQQRHAHGRRLREACYTTQSRGLSCLAVSERVVEVVEAGTVTLKESINQPKKRAIRRVFNIPELLETILSCLPTGDLMKRIPLVCRGFRDAVQDSLQIQRWLFRKPDHSVALQVLPLKGEPFQISHHDPTADRLPFKCRTAYRVRVSLSWELESTFRSWRPEALLFTQPPVFWLRFVRHSFAISALARSFIYHKASNCCISPYFSKWFACGRFDQDTISRSWYTPVKVQSRRLPAATRWVLGRFETPGAPSCPGIRIRR